MINYKIGDLVNRINTMYTKLSGGYANPSAPRAPMGGDLEGFLEVPYTKDNYQIICQLIKLGILKDYVKPQKGAQMAAGEFGFCQVALTGSLEPFHSTPLGAPKGGAPKGLTKKNILTLVSKPGRKVYTSYKNLKDLNNGFKLYILRTSQGIITSQTAFKYKIGGEVLLKISF
jgi:ribosomal protein S8